MKFLTKRSLKWNKFENLDKEGSFIKSQLDPFLGRANHRKMNPNQVEHLNKDDLVRIYFDMLPESDIYALYKIYETDFKMFGYTFTYKNITFPN